MENCVLMATVLSAAVTGGAHEAGTEDLNAKHNGLWLTCCTHKGICTKGNCPTGLEGARTSNWPRTTAAALAT